ncbi:MAG: hypothetical protein DRO73_11870 [Candidatus Thorarchaeota archaeon]|nr:MAG: hypothetical protein DRO73_11870 [Candidatus Thorarchaeota archaeon]
MSLSSDIDRIIFVPVIHTDAESVEKVRSIVRSVRPDVVAVELDRERYEQIRNPPPEDVLQQMSPTGDVVQDLMHHIAVLERNLGSLVGSDAGAEMLAAIEEGRAVGAKIALVDRPLQATIQALMRVPLDEVYRFAELIPKAAQEIDSGEANEVVSTLREEQGVAEIMSQFREQFPSISRALIDERDEYVARFLQTILDDVEGKIVVVLGAGHVEGVRTKLEEILRTKTAG